MAGDDRLPETSKRCTFLTGVTGLVGGYLLDRLLDLPGLDIHVLVRSRDVSAARARLRALGAYFGSENRFAHISVHCGDITLPDLGLARDAAERLREETTDVIHAAASISFTDREENRRTNEQGIRSLLALFPHSARFFHVSTAYVGGRSKTFQETDLDVGQSFRNDYERSKLEAEKTVRAHYGDAPGLLTVLRPSIVIGEQETGRTFQFFTLYKVLRMMGLFARRHPGGTFALTYDPDGTQNYIPVDRLSGMIEEIFLTPRLWGRTYHLVNDHPVTNREFRGMLEDCFGFTIANRHPGPEARPLNRVSVESTREYLAYLHGEPYFGCEARNDLRSSSQPMPFDAGYLRRLLQYCEETAWGKRLAVCR